MTAIFLLLRQPSYSPKDVFDVAAARASIQRRYIGNIGTMAKIVGKDWLAPGNQLGVWQHRYWFSWYAWPTLVDYSLVSSISSTSRLHVFASRPNEHVDIFQNRGDCHFRLAKM